MMLQHPAGISHTVVLIYKTQDPLQGRIVPFFQIPYPIHYPVPEMPISGMGQRP
jgi:hypothetical protein